MKNKIKLKDILNKIITTPSSSNIVNDNKNDSDLFPQIKTIIYAADLKKGSNITMIHLPYTFTQFRYFIFITSTSNPQTRAIYYEIMNCQEKTNNLYLNKNERKVKSNWVILDYGDVIAHIMTKESRNYYDIENYWLGLNGEYIDVSKYLIKKVLGKERNIQIDSWCNKDDPFWY